MWLTCNDELTITRNTKQYVCMCKHACNYMAKVGVTVKITVLKSCHHLSGSHWSFCSICSFLQNNPCWAQFHGAYLKAITC